MQIVSTCLARDLRVYQAAYRSLRRHFPDSEINVITRKSDFKRFHNACDADLILWDEDSMIPGMTLDELKSMSLPFFPRGAGWYYQQFLKLSFVNYSNSDEYYLIWDADTILLHPLEFFDSDGKPYYTIASEHHLPYFETFKSLFGVEANREYSFISQHQIINKKVLLEMFNEIERNHSSSVNWCWAIMDNLAGTGSNLFSEYETYGHFLKLKYSDAFSVRNIKWTRNGGGFLGLPPWPPILRLLAMKYKFSAFEASNTLMRRIIRALTKYMR